MKAVYNFSKTFLAIVTGITMIASLGSCKKDEPVPTPTASTIVDVVNGNPNFSLLKKAIMRADLDSILSTGNLTVFAPDNDAFAAAGITSGMIDTLPLEDLTAVLAYHVLGSKVVSSAVPTSDTVKTLQGTNLYASKNSNGVFVNGIKVKTADIQADNGVIHVISNVLFPPTDNIAELAGDEPNLSLVLAAAVRAGLAGALTSAGKYTVFAPTNAAFAAAGYPDVTSINNADPVDLAAIVKAHVLPTNVFSSDLISGANVPTLQSGVSLLVNTTPPSVKITTSNNPASNIVVPAGVDIIATNGVIHVIDRVIL
jgi:uncharacterized surface protein with fasciclin (FAS1) repeats